MKVDNTWWKNAVIYQIYPRSFQDSNGDGIGDLQGIIQRLDYLKGLGVDALWLCPVYPSPMDDNGYDISDYCGIDPSFGTMEDMEELIAQAGSRGIRIIMDLVLNHSSDEHPWFQEAKQNRTSPYHDYYIWRDGVEGIPPNGMKACFGGSAWTWVPELRQYYFHQFSVKQPDLNWDNHKVRQDLYGIIRFWMKKGVGGFRLDVIDQIAKVPDQEITNNGPMLHPYLREMNRATFGGTELVTVGEAWGATPELARKFSDPTGDELSMVFQFEHMILDQVPGKEKWDLAPFELSKLKQVLSKWQTQLYGTGWNSLFWNNHDLPRIVSRWGDDGVYRVESAKMLATLLYGLQGTPYIYQGEELGMTNARYPIQEYRDIETLNLYRERLAHGFPEENIMASIHAKGRDNARTPMQWTDGLYAGFSTVDPWLKVNPNHTQINAQSQLADSDSVYHYYRKLIALRKRHGVFAEGKYELLCPNDPNIFAYKRVGQHEILYVVCNFGALEAELPSELRGVGHNRLITNYPQRESMVLCPFEAFMCLSGECASVKKIEFKETKQ